MDTMNFEFENVIKFNGKDIDIINYIDNNNIDFQVYIKELIRKDIEKDKDASTDYSKILNKYFK